MRRSEPGEAWPRVNRRQSSSSPEGFSVTVPRSTCGSYARVASPPAPPRPPSKSAAPKATMSSSRSSTIRRQPTRTISARSHSTRQGASFRRTGCAGRRARRRDRPGRFARHAGPPRACSARSGRARGLDRSQPGYRLVRRGRGPGRARAQLRRFDSGRRTCRPGQVGQAGQARSAEETSPRVNQE